MHKSRLRSMVVVLALALAGPASGAVRYLEISYPASDKPGELALGVTYTLWLPDDVSEFHGVTLFFTTGQKGLKVCLYKHSAPGK